ncbi:MAG: hypothetical protein EXR62_17745 [Chloroflexi bacterium]|nr:hypothetical protein [Chloroflexota bacterium]
MAGNWFKEYITLAFQIERRFHREAHSWFIDAYYGPPEWKEAAEALPESAPVEMLRGALDLANALPAQDFAPQRETFLAKQVLAMETICRKLNGECFTLEEEVARCLDIQIAWTAEAEFEAALALYDQALPGTGDPGSRYLAWRARHELPSEKNHLLSELLPRVLAEVRRRTLAFVPLPPDEGVEIRVVTNKNFGAANWYLGNFRSLIEFHAGQPLNLEWLPWLMAHESYPGHHTEFSLKEQHIWHEQGQLEQTIFLSISPQLVIAEGIATLAPEMIFAPGEAEGWLGEHVYPLVGTPTDDADNAGLEKAHNILQAVPANATFMIQQGQPDAAIIAYLMKYTFASAERAHKRLEGLKSPFMRPYIFSYIGGKRLMSPLLQGNDRQVVFRRFLTEQIYPSLLQHW